MKDLKIVTFNLRCVWLGDGINGGVHRAGMILEKIRRERPAVICFQEVIDVSARFLEECLSEYNLLFSRRGENYDGEGIAIAYRRDRLDLFSLDTKWLSPTPEEAGSLYPMQSGCPRIFQCALFREKGTGELFRVINVHMDHINEEVPELEAKQLIAYLSEANTVREMPFFILGDFNSLPESKALMQFNATKSPVIRDLTAGVTHTFHEFGRLHADDKLEMFGRECVGMKIDYVLSDEATARLPHKVVLWDDELHGIYLSDHYPVSVEFE